MDYLLKDIVTKYKANYEREKNPRHVWEAIRVIYAGKTEFPEWVREYLYRVAKSLMEESKKTGSKDDDIVGILEFKDLRQLNDPELIGASESIVMNLMFQKVKTQGMTQGKAAKQIEKEINNGLKKGQVGYWGESKILKRWKKWKENPT